MVESPIDFLLEQPNYHKLTVYELNSIAVYLVRTADNIVVGSYLNGKSGYCSKIQIAL